MLSNGLAAILSGLVSGLASDAFGPVAPFDMAILCFALSSAYIFTKWNENYGQCSAGTTDNFVDAWRAMVTEPKIWMLGLIQSCFEGTMYVFVFSWTPILGGSDANLPHGV